MGVRKNFKLIFSYFALNIKKEWQYKASFIMQIVTMILNDAFFIIQWKMIFSFVDKIGNYGFNEVMLLWSVSAGTFGVAHTFFGGAWEIKNLVYDGKLDVFLTQPKNVLINVACSQTDISAIGDIIYSFVVLIIVQAPWWKFLALIPIIIISGFIYTSVYIFYVSLCFYVKGGDALGSAVESTMTKVTNYPPVIYDILVKVILFTIIPVAFSCFVPAENILLNFNLMSIFAYLLIGCIWVSLAFISFNMGLKKYNSGSVMGGRI